MAPRKPTLIGTRLIFYYLSLVWGRSSYSKVKRTKIIMMMPPPHLVQPDSREAEHHPFHPPPQIPQDPLFSTAGGGVGAIMLV